MVKLEQVSAFTERRVPPDYSSEAQACAFNPTSVFMKTQ